MRLDDYDHDDDGPRRSRRSRTPPDWLLGYETFDPNDYLDSDDDDEHDDEREHGDHPTSTSSKIAVLFPEIALDPENNTVSVINSSYDSVKVYYVSVLRGGCDDDDGVDGYGVDVRCSGRGGMELEAGFTTTTRKMTTADKAKEKKEKKEKKKGKGEFQDYDGKEGDDDGGASASVLTTTTSAAFKSVPCTTFIAVLPPLTMAHLCSVGDAAITMSPRDDGYGSTSVGSVVSTPSFDLTKHVKIVSDVSIMNPHPDPYGECHTYPIAFPLGLRQHRPSSETEDEEDEDEEEKTEEGTSRRRRERGGYLCTQGEGGDLTHFLRGNHHAYDFRCPVGTPILAGGDGIVVAVKDGCEGITGVGASNLYDWNSVMIRLDGVDVDNGDDVDDVDVDVDDKDGRAKEEEEDDDKETKASPSSSNSDNNGNNNDDGSVVVGGRPPLYVEYVHIKSRSILCCVGQRIHRNDTLALSGNAGFSPEPHLHVSAFHSADSDAPTVRFKFSSALASASASASSSRGGETTFVPMAGFWYDDDGEI